MTYHTSLYKGQNRPYFAYDAIKTFHSASFANALVQFQKISARSGARLVLLNEDMLRIEPPTMSDAEVTQYEAIAGESGVSFL